MAHDSNTDQIDFWNTGPGRHWVTHADTLDVMHRGALEILMDAAAPAGGEIALDIGCGAGATTLALAERVGPEGRATGIDVAEPLLALARARAERAGATTVRFVRADAQDHAFAQGAADLVVSRMGVMFFSDPVRAFANLRAALRPGGRLCFVCWSGPENNMWFRVPMEAGARHLGALPPATDPHAPGPMACRDTDRVTGILANAGFTGIETTAEPFALHHPGGVAPLLEVAMQIGSLPRLIRDTSPDPETVEAIREDMRREMEAHETDAGVQLPAEVHVVRAVRD